MPPVASAIFLSVVFVEVRLHELAVLIFREFGAAILARHRHEFAGRAADADGENLHAILRRGLRRGDCPRRRDLRRR